MGEPFCLAIDGIRMTRETRQQIVDEMTHRLAELLPKEYRGEYEKVTGNALFFTEECTMDPVNLA